ncbi:MAG: hypothetical protein SFW66_06515 [Gammaproteobacteria bacterium]|nr:hypothetical protein [Gammaproteobacteria bacterium]
MRDQNQKVNAQTAFSFFTREEVQQHNTENDYWTVITVDDEALVFNFSQGNHPPHPFTFKKMFTDEKGDFLSDSTDRMNPKHFKTSFILSALMKNNFIGKIKPIEGDAPSASLRNNMARP